MPRTVLDRAGLLARLWYFDPATPVPLTLLTSTAADALPKLSVEDDIEQVLELLRDLTNDGLVVKAEGEWAFHLSPAGQAAANELPEELRHEVADPVERMISGWHTLLDAGDLPDESATAERLLAHIASVAARASARGDARIAIGMHVLRGQALLRRGDGAGAAKDAEAALAALDKLGDDEGLGAQLAHDFAALVAFYQSDLAAAETHTRAALALMSPESDQPAVLRHTLHLAVALAQQDHHAEVLALLEPAMLQVRRGQLTPATSDVPMLLRVYGASLIATGAYDEGLALLRDAVAQLEAGDNPEDLAGALDDLALALGQVGQIDAAMAAYEQMLQLVQAHELFNASTALSLSNFAGILRTRGEQERARSLLQRAQVIARLTRADPDLLTMIASNLDDLESMRAGERSGPVQMRSHRTGALLQPLRTVVTVLVEGLWPVIDAALLRLPDDASDEALDLLDASLRQAALAGTALAIRAIHAHVLRHQDAYEALGITLVALPRQGAEQWPADDFCIFSDQTLRDEEEDLSFAEEVQHAILRGALSRLQDDLTDAGTLPGHILAPVDTFFSAPDDAPSVSPATWEALERDPAPFMLVDVDLLVLPFALPNRAALLAADPVDDEDEDELADDDGLVDEEAGEEGELDDDEGWLDEEGP